MVTIQGSDGKRYRIIPKIWLWIGGLIVSVTVFSIQLFVYDYIRFIISFIFIVPLLIIIPFINIYKMIEIDRSYKELVEDRILEWRIFFTLFSRYYHTSETGGVSVFKSPGLIFNLKSNNIYLIKMNGKLVMFGPRSVVKYIETDPDIESKEIKDIPKFIIADPEISL